MYQCNECESIYETQEQALNCCADDRVSRFSGYICEMCEEVHGNRRDAVECCADICEVDESGNVVIDVENNQYILRCPSCAEPIRFRSEERYGDTVFAVCENPLCALHGQTQRPPESILDIPYGVRFNPYDYIGA